MQKKLLIVLLSFLSLMTIPFVVNAATITSCTLDKETYLQGQTGYMTVRIYNDKEDEIQITELTATIDYYYTDGNVYLQTFYTSADLPIEIQQGHSSTFDIAFSLPTNIASGYTDIYVRAKTELWDSQSERWRVSDHATYQQELFIESPFKQELEDQQAANQQLQTQLQEEQSINEYITKMAYFFGATTILLAAVTGFLIVLYRKTRIITQPTA
jgi:sporulation-control protein spo0M